MPFRREHLIPIRRVIVCIVSLISIVATLAPAQQFDPKLYRELRWRLIGPFRGGRSVAISGIPSQPMSSIWRQTTAGGGRKQNTGAPGIRFLTVNLTGRAGAWRVRPRR